MVLPDSRKVSVTEKRNDMGEHMNQYELLEPFQNKNAGFSRWTYAKKYDKYYVLKEFLDPIHPTDDSLSLDVRKQRIRECKTFEEKKKRLYKAVNEASCGNTVRISEFFRYGNHYYIATERIVGQKIPLAAMPAVPLENRLLLCKSLAFEMMSLHKLHIVHADIKESNILLKQTKTGKLVGKIIDFDASFFEDDQPTEEEELGGDQVYLSPEGCQFICGEAMKLTCKIDVFALGLLFHQYLTGKLPGFDTTEYDYAFDAVLDGQTLEISKELPQNIQNMLQGMLACDPLKRLTMEQVYGMLGGKKTGDEEKKASEKTPETKENSRGWFRPAGDLEF